MPVIPRGQNGGTRGQVREGVQSVEFIRLGLLVVALQFLRRSFRLALLALEFVQFGDEPRNVPGADVLADHAAILLANAVVVASLPRHRLCYL